MIAFDSIDQYPQQLDLEYNIWEYLTFDEVLEKRYTAYNLDFPEDKTMSFPRFLELFYFARRRNFGKATVDIIGANHEVAKRGQASRKAQGTFAIKKSLAA